MEFFLFQMLMDSASYSSRERHRRSAEQPKQETKRASDKPKKGFGYDGYGDYRCYRHGRAKCSECGD